MNMLASTASATVAGLGWIQRRAPKVYTGMDGLLEHLEQRSHGSKSMNAKSRAVQLHYVENPQTKDEMNKLALVHDGKPLELTHWSFGQLARLGKAPADYLRRLPAALVGDVLNYNIQIEREVEDVQLYHDGEELRAITGPGYGRVMDHEIVGALRNVIDSGRWVAAEKHMGLRATDRSLQMFLIDKQNPIVVGRAPNGADDVIYRGLRISNSEVGYSSLAVDAFTFRSYCLNGMIFGMKDNARFTIRHSKGAPYRWAREIQPAIESYANTDGMKLVDAVNAAKEAQVAKDDDAALAFLNKRMGFSVDRSRKIMEIVEQEENQRPRSAWSMIQGITAFARTIEGTEERADMERTAGQIWERATRNAA